MDLDTSEPREAIVVIRYEHCPKLISLRGFQTTKLRQKDPRCRWYSDSTDTHEVWGVVCQQAYMECADGESDEGGVRTVLRAPDYKLPKYSGEKQCWPQPKHMLKALRQFSGDLRQAFAGPLTIAEYFRTVEGAQWARVRYFGNNLLVYHGLDIHWRTHQLGWPISLGGAKGVAFTRWGSDWPRLSGLTIIDRRHFLKEQAELSSSTASD